MCAAVFNLKLKLSSNFNLSTTKLVGLILKLNFFIKAQEDYSPIYRTKIAQPYYLNIVVLIASRDKKNE